MYRYRYINKHCQFGRTNYTLILEDLENEMPTVRIEKEFGIDKELIDEDFLYTEAKKDIISAQEAYKQSLLDIVIPDSTGDE